MDPVELVLILALVAYSIYRQTQKREVIGNCRFKLAIIYAIIGILIGGFRPPIGFWPILVLAISLSLSLVVGWLRGGSTRSSGSRTAASTAEEPR